MSSGIAEVGIVGAGRFGKYLSEQLKLKKVNSLITDVNETDFGEAIAWLINNVKLLILAVPIREFESCLKQLASIIPVVNNCELVVVDVCSVKEYPAQMVKRHLHNIKGYVGLHPLFGPQSAPVSCTNQRIAICQDYSNPDFEEVAQLVHDLIIHPLGLNYIECTAEEHDREMAYTQVLDHYIGQSAASMKIERTAMSTTTHNKLMDIVEIVTGNSVELFEDMNKYNTHTPMARARLRQALFDVELRL